MDRLGEIVLMGEKYPLNLSMRATRLFSERFGGMSNAAEALSGKSEDEVLDILTWMLSVLIQQGCAYKDLMLEARPKKVLSKDDLEVLLAPADIDMAMAAVFGAFASGSAREVKTEDEEKNAASTQG